MSTDPNLRVLECPECSWDVLPSGTGLWDEDRAPEHCPSCGALVAVVVDDGDPERVEARAVLLERGGEVVARLKRDLRASRDHHRRDVDMYAGALGRTYLAIDPSGPAGNHGWPWPIGAVENAARELRARAEMAERALSEMQADDEPGCDPRECSSHHSGIEESGP